MSRLPEPGADEGVWGDILNDFLAVSHMDDGTIRVSALPTPQVADGSVTPAKLSQPYVPVSQKGAAGGVASLDGGGKVPVGQMPSGFIGADATTSSKGVVRLAGDLSGDADNPTVPGLASKYVKPAGGIPESDLDGAVQTKLNSGGTMSDATTTSKGAVQLAGDLSGTAAAPTVPGLAGKVNTSAVGAVGGVASLDGSGRVPTSQLPAGFQADATTTSKGIIQLAGDLGGTAAAPTVPGLAAKADSTNVMHLTGNETVTGLKIFTSSIEVPDPENDLDTANKRYVDAIAVGTPDADATTKGKLKLAGDLGGTADLPTVPGLVNKANDSAVVHSTGNETVAGIKTFSSSPIVPTPTTGTQTANKSYVDNTIASSSAPDATSSSKGIVQLAGDLGGTAAAPTVIGKVASTEKGAANGVATLDSGGKIPTSQLPPNGRIQAYSSSGLLMADVGAHRLYNDTSTAWTILSVRATVGTAPSGSSIVVDVNVSGTTIFTTQANRPTIAAASNTSGKITNMNVTNVPVGSYISVDVDQVGSTTPGNDLSVQVEVL